MPTQHTRTPPVSEEQSSVLRVQGEKQLRLRDRHPSYRSPLPTCLLPAVFPPCLFATALMRRWGPGVSLGTPDLDSPGGVYEEGPWLEDSASRPRNANWWFRPVPSLYKSLFSGFQQIPVFPQHNISCHVKVEKHTWLGYVIVQDSDNGWMDIFPEFYNFRTKPKYKQSLISLGRKSWK